MPASESRSAQEMLTATGENLTYSLEKPVQYSISQSCAAALLAYRIEDKVADDLLDSVDATEEHQPALSGKRFIAPRTDAHFFICKRETSSSK